MKATELMHGDWYSALNGDNKRDYYQFDFNDECWGDAEPLPIRLTTEILEANGFEHIQNLSYNGREFYAFPNNKGLYDRGFGVEYVNGKVFYITDHQLMPFKYVHKFQQILRLCGMNSIADNFKVG